MKGTRFEAVFSIQQTLMRELKAIWEKVFSWAIGLLYEQCKCCADMVWDNIEEWY
jgi:hypothetical protein